MSDYPELLLAGIAFVAMAAQWLAWRLRLPAILFLLLAGLAVGPVGGILDPDELFTNLLFPMVSISVSIILFEGSLTLRFREIRGLEKVVRRLVTSGTVLAWGLIAIASHWIMGFPWDLSFLFGAITVVTGPTVIAALLKIVRPVAPVANAMRWEGILIDPIGALLAVLAYELLVALHSSYSWQHAMWVFGITIFSGSVGGILSGAVTTALLRKKLLPESLVSLGVLAIMVTTFAISNAFNNESGLLAVTIMGIWLANQPGVPVEDILAFKATLSQRLLSALFIILAARMDLELLGILGWKAVALLVVMFLVIRPISVAVSTVNSRLSWRERALLAWIAPRGIVAAAVSALFALRLDTLEVAHSEALLPLTFLVIMGSVIWQSLTARPIAKLLKVTEPEPIGFLIVGANPVARAIGLALQAQKIPVRLCDSDWYSLSKARMLGLPTYFGMPVSEHAQRHMDTTGLGRLLALGARDHVNQLIMLRARDEYGKNKVFSLPRSQMDDMQDKHAPAPALRGRTLFGEGLGYWRLSNLLHSGAEIKATTLTGSFGFKDYLSTKNNRTYPLFAITPKGYARPFTLDRKLNPEAGWTMIVLHINTQDQSSTRK